MNKFGLALFLGMLALINAQAPRYRQQQQFQRFRQQPQFFSRQVQGPRNGPYAAAGWQPNGARLVLPARQEVPITTDYPSTTTDYPEESPSTIQPGYEASGWKPQGERLVLPARQQAPPAASYGVPQQTYGVPASAYGAPARQYGPPPAVESFGTTNSPKEAESTEVTDVDSAAPTANPEAEELDLGSGQTSNGRLETEDVPQQQLPEQAGVEQQPGAYFVQYPDGSIQRVVYLAQPAGQVALQAQPVSQPIQLYNPVLVPNFVSYSSQYQQSW